MIGERVRDGSLQRAKRLRSVARHLSNAPINETGSERLRVSRRRAALAANLHELAQRSERFAQGLTADDPAAPLDNVLVAALRAHEDGDRERFLSIVTSTTMPIAEMLGTGETLRSAPDLLIKERAASSEPKPRPPFSYRSMDVALALRDVAEGSSDPPVRVMEGNFAVFNEWTEINDIWEGTFLERIAPGAFKRTFAENRDNIRVLFQHGRDALMGYKPMGTIETLEETKRGAHYVAPLFRSVPDLIIEGLDAKQFGASFRFAPVQESWVDKPQPSEYNPRGIPERTLIELDVAEFGPVTFPAYTGASAGLRSRSLTSKFYVVGSPAGRLDAGSTSGGEWPEGGERSLELQAQLEARDRELRILGVIK